MNRTWFNSLKRRKSSPFFQIFIWTEFSTFSVCEPVNILGKKKTKQKFQICFQKYLSLFPNSGLCQVQYVHLISTSLALPLSNSQRTAQIFMRQPCLPINIIIPLFIFCIISQKSLNRFTNMFYCKVQFGDWQLAVKYW